MHIILILYCDVLISTVCSYMAENLPLQRKTISNQSINLLLNFEKDICIIACVLQIKHLVQCKKSHLFSKLLKKEADLGRPPAFYVICTTTLKQPVNDNE